MPDVQSYHVEWFISQNVVRQDVTIQIVDGHVVDVVAGRTSAAISLGSVALVDGLVNAHTHLEFSHVTEPIGTGGRFTDWIRDVVNYRRENPSVVRAAIAAGMAESLDSGTTLVGDIATVGWSPRDYAEAGFKGVVFQEILGLTPERISQQKVIAKSHACNQRPDIVAGISPHAPYSTDLELVTDAVAIARQTGCPIAMHLAETTAELELIATAKGEFRGLLSDFGIWREDMFRPSRSALDYLEILAHAPRVLIIHGNYLNETELSFLARRPNMTLVYCPRTHAAFGHAPHPWRRLLELGGRVAIGTDSRASNPDLSLFAELQFLASNHPAVSHLELLRLGSVEGRRALGFETTDLMPAANFTLIRGGDTAISDPKRDLFAAGHRVCGTMIDGVWIRLSPPC